MPGIEVGDIGPKYNWEVKDNGYLAFFNYWIPWENMLMWYQVLTREGNLKVVQNPKILYSTMLLTWIYILQGSSWHFAIGLTTAIWYAFVRTQFKDKAGSNSERQLIEY